MALSCKSWLSNEGGKHLLLILWLSVNVLLFWKTFTLYYHGAQYYYLHRMLGLGLCISRASASVLNLNCSLVLLPMCRTLLAFLRGSQKIMSRKARRLLDKSKTFHITCGFTICLFSVVHVAAHMVNALNFSLHYSEEFPALNVARYRDEDPRKILFTTVPGVTGFFMVLVLFLMCTSSSYSLRHSNYDIFWYTHNLFIVFYILLLLHVTGGMLKYQTNLNEHTPGCIDPNKTLIDDIPVSEYPPESNVEPEPVLENNFQRICTEAPKFQSNLQETWFWVSGPLCLYCAERLYRYIRSNKPVTIISVNSHPCDVIEVRMVKDNFTARPGQYIVLHCPSVSTFESHPFTLTMSPAENRRTFGIHLRVLGDWTRRFRELLLSETNMDAEILPILQQRNYPKLYIDGPFGSPSEEVFNYEVSLCVAGGIGVTPFASVLNTLLVDWKQYKLRRLYFIWVCKEIQSFLWFADLLCLLHDKLWQENRPDYLNIQLYLSQTDGLQDCLMSFSQLMDKYDISNTHFFRYLQNLNAEKYQVLNSRLVIGKPRLKLLFGEIAKCNRQAKSLKKCMSKSGYFDDISQCQGKLQITSMQYAVNHGSALYHTFKLKVRMEIRVKDLAPSKLKDVYFMLEPTGKCVGVFCCGPSKLSKELHNLSNRTCSHGTKFEYNKESFS